MQYDLLPWILQQEAKAFQRIENQWRPSDLLPEIQSKLLMNGLVKKYEYLSAATDELSSLDRADIYHRLLKQMGLNVRKALYFRRSNQVAFLQSVAEFYTDFGRVLRLLKIDDQRGKFKVLEESQS